MILDDAEDRHAESPGSGRVGRRTADALENRRLILAASTLRPPGTRVGPGENVAHQVGEVADGCVRESALVLWRAAVRPGGQAPAGSGWGGERLCHRIEGAVDGGLGDVGEAEVVVAGIGPQPGEGLVQMEAGAF
jgi:hypothetical protein